MTYDNTLTDNTHISLSLSLSLPPSLSPFLPSLSPCYGEQSQCAFPTAEVYLVDSGARPLLHPHVHYTFNLELDLPESAANKDAGGRWNRAEVARSGISNTLCCAVVYVCVILSCPVSVLATYGRMSCGS